MAALLLLEGFSRGGTDTERTELVKDGAGAAAKLACSRLRRRRVGAAAWGREFAAAAGARPGSASSAVGMSLFLVKAAIELGPY